MATSGKSSCTFSSCFCRHFKGGLGWGFGLQGFVAVCTKCNKVQSLKASVVEELMEASLALMAPQCPGICGHFGSSWFLTSEFLLVILFFV